jgi:hypothetical protein
MTRRPFLSSGALRLAGFMCAMLARTAKGVPPELVRFRRAEQMRRLAAIVKSRVTLRTERSRAI